MGRQVILRSDCREDLLAQLEAYLNAGALLTPGSFFHLPAAAEYETLPIDHEGLQELATLLHTGRRPVLKCALTESDKPPVFGAVVLLTEEYEFKQLRTQYRKVLVCDVLDLPRKTAADKKFYDLVKNWNIFDVVTRNFPAVAKADEKRLGTALQQAFDSGKLSDLRHYVLCGACR